MASPKNLHSVQRIISFPITRPRDAFATLHDPGHKQALTFYQFQVHLPKSKKRETNQSKWQPKGGWTHWVQSKASSTWAGFGQAPEGNWKFKVFRMGERLVDRLDYEELALKGVDPSMGPSILHLDVRGRGAEETNEKQKVIIPLLYPPSIQSAESSLSHLRQLIHAREPRHKKGFLVWMIIAPFTAPFMIIPIIPNLPFFFCVWRSWSHYRAYRASQYLAALIKHGHVVSAPSLELDTIYKRYGPKSLIALPRNPSSSPSPSHATAENIELLLTREAVPPIVSTFSLEESSTSNIYRAIEQARVRTESPT
ncbi:mitochondrial K+-H+ exchange-related-domain-containing protein [Lentinula aciculospora]|uniref:Mitochondrial K+-H+ exchange-related-domain-containing protein n=1 Tax=Lentinula aciculospora TaxID=153920 RepID=A0A9W9DRT3_9AGAR|nr:mitochondrial K+-H+ exchange-related-domain-containing protein [Lentinula aciculospora]